MKEWGFLLSLDSMFAINALFSFCIESKKSCARFNPFSMPSFVISWNSAVPTNL